MGPRLHDELGQDDWDSENWSNYLTTGSPYWLLPPVSRFSKNNGHAAKKQTVLDKFAAFFERYFGLA